MKQKVQETAEIWPCQNQSEILHVCGKLNSSGVFIQLYHSCIGNFCWKNSGTSSIDFMGQEGKK